MDGWLGGWMDKWMDGYQAIRSMTWLLAFAFAPAHGVLFIEL